MKILIRYFFKTVRILAGPVILFINWITMPRGIVRPAEEQEKIDNKTKDMVLYQFKTCPFCIKVRREKKRLSLNIETRDAQHNPQFREQLLQGGGKIKVPCLKTSDSSGSPVWMYNSNEIKQYLKDNFAA